MTTVQPEAGSRLAQLAATYDQVKAAADEATKQLKAITDAIKIELTQAAPGQADIGLTSEHLTKPLRLTYGVRKTVDTKRFKAEQPALYEHYSKESGSWTLKAVSS